MIIAKGVPTTPTLAQLAKDIDGDGKVDIAIQATMSDVAMAVAFELEVSEATASGGTFVVIDNRISAALKQAFRAKTTRWYKVRYRPIYEGGTVGTWSALSAELKPAAKSATVTAPTSLTVTPKLKGNRLRWSKSTEADYRETIIYRHTADVIASAVEIDRVTGTVFTDHDALTAGSTYYYWVAHVDTSGNVSAKYPTVNGASGVYALVADADTDQTAPSVPGGLALVQTATDVDEDGKVDIALKATWNAATGAKFYELEITQGTDVTYVQVKGRSHIFKAKSNKLYSVKVAAISFNGTQSAFSTAVTSTPVKKSAAPSIAESVSVVAKPKGMLVVFAQCTDFDYSRSTVWRDTTPTWGTAVFIGSASSNRYVDQSELTVGTTYYYWIRHVDTSGNFGPQNTAAASAVYKAAQVGDIDNGAVTTAKVAAGAVTGDKLGIGVGANYIDNSDLKAGLLGWGYEWSNSFASFTLSLRTDTYAPDPGAIQIYQIDGTASLEYGIRQADSAGAAVYHSVAASKWYELSIYFYGHRCTGIQPYIQWLDGSNVHISYSTPGITEAAQNGNPLKLLSNYSRSYFKVQAPAGAAKALIFVRMKGTKQGLGYTDSYLWITRPFFAEANANQSEATPWSPSGGNIITVSMTDQTALIQVTGFALAQAAKDVDEDGKVDIAITATWSALTGAKQYEIEVTEAGTVIDNHITAGLKKTFKAKSNKLYSVRIRAISFNNTVGVWLTTPLTITPTKKSAAVTAPAGLVVTARPKGNRLRWTAPVDKDYAFTNVYRHTADVIASAVLIDTVSGATHLDQDALTAGSTYYYWIAHVDTSGNVSAKHPTVNGVSVTHAAIAAADTDATALAAPAGTPSLTQRNQDVDADGTVDIALQVTWAAVTGAVRYEVEVSTSATTNGTYAVIDNHMTTGLIKAFSASTLHFYRVRVRAFSFNGTVGAWSAVAPSATTGVQPAPKGAAPAAPTYLNAQTQPLIIQTSWSPSDDPDYAYSNLYYSSVNDFAFATVLTKVYGRVHNQPWSSGDQYYHWVTHVNTSGVESSKYPVSNTGGVSGTCGYVDTADIATSAATTAKIANNAITPAKLATASSFGVSRIHANDDTTAYDFSTNTTSCAYLHNSGIIRASRTDGKAAEFQRTGSDGQVIGFYRGATSVGYISVTTTGTSYNTGSDYRLKYDVEPLVTVTLTDPGEANWLPVALCRILAARPVTYRWRGIDGPNSPLTYGFIAHELQAVFPEAVTGEKDAVEAIGTATIDDKPRTDITERDAIENGATDWQKAGERPVYQSVDHSKLVPSLLASVQELTMLVLELRREIEALKA